MAGLKYMFAKANNFQADDIYDFMPHHEAPEIAFDEAAEMYNAE